MAPRHGIPEITLPTSIPALQQRLREFAGERDWEKFHDPKNLAMLLASEVGELVAEFRWLTSQGSRDVVSDPAAIDRIAKEIGDVGIALLGISDKLGIDLLAAIEAKIDENGKAYPPGPARGKADRPAAQPLDR
jgi:NTP pyrophosphatase (non-canonical NTP hydrolase)